MGVVYEAEDLRLGRHPSRGLQKGTLGLELSATPLDNDSLPQEVLPIQFLSTSIRFSSASSASARPSSVPARDRTRRVPAANGRVEYLFPAGPYFLADTQNCLFRKQRCEPGPLQLPLSIITNVLKKKVSECDRGDSLSRCPLTHNAHSIFVFQVGAWPRQFHRPELDSGPLGLSFHQTRRTACIATRFALELNAVSSAATWMFGCCRRRCSVQALSLPLIHDRRTFVTRG
jgi:hypothetical protein